MSEPPVRDVVRVMELVGPRGGTLRCCTYLWLHAHRVRDQQATTQDSALYVLLDQRTATEQFTACG